MKTQMDESIEYFQAKLEELNKLKRELMVKEKSFNDEFGPWIIGLIGKEQFSPLDILKKGYDSGRRDGK